jgi:hypothetical protein
MKRFVLALSAYIVFFVGFLATVLAIFALIDPEKDDLGLRYFLGGTAIISFIISWLLLNLSRKK